MNSTLRPPLRTPCPRASPVARRPRLPTARAAPIGVANDAERAAVAVFTAAGGDDASAGEMLARAAKEKVKGLRGMGKKGCGREIIDQNGSTPPQTLPFPPTQHTQSVDVDDVLGALAFKATRAPAASDPIAAADVAAAWDLVYAAPSPIPAWAYIPVPEVFDLTAGVTPGAPCALRSIVFGVLHFAFRGAVAGWDAENGALSFRFTSVNIAFGSPDAKPFFTKELSRKSDKVYTFFGHDAARGVLCARSSSGMVTLLSRGR